MKLEITSRPFTPDEASYVSKWIEPRLGCTVLAAWLVFVPIAGASAVSISLIFTGLWQGLIIAISFAIGFALGVVGLRRQKRRFREMVDHYVAVRRRAQERGVMSVVRCKPTRIWEVCDLEDFGPGIVLDTDTEQCVYLRGSYVPECGENTFPGTDFVVEVIPELNEIWALRVAEGVTPLVEDLIPFHHLGVDLGDEMSLLPRSQVLDALAADRENMSAD